jgi:mono/diheme cytochrome c family protein
VRLILAGSELPSTQAAPSNLGMPGFAWRLSDAEVAQLGTFVRNSWGNQAPEVTVAQAKAVRDSLATEGTAKHGAPHDPTQADAGDK